MATATRTATEDSKQTGNLDLPENRTRGIEKQSTDRRGAESAGPENTIRSMRSSADGQSFPDEVQLLAYHYWVERGCPDGSPDEDLFRAECAVRENHERI